jgi:hypothetical protein
MEQSVERGGGRGRLGGHPPLGYLTGEPVRTIDFIDDFLFSTGEPIERND